MYPVNITPAPLQGLHLLNCVVIVTISVDKCASGGRRKTASRDTGSIIATTCSLSSSSSLSDTVAGAPKLDDVISRKSLAEIAKKITSWKALGPYLDLSRPQEEEIVQKYRENYGMQKRECLEVWKVMKGEGATYRALISAVEEAGDRQLADCVRSLLEK